MGDSYGEEDEKKNNKLSKCFKPALRVNKTFRPGMATKLLLRECWVVTCSC